MRGAAGNMVRIRHANRWITVYMHLHGFADGVGPGAIVRQGDGVGEVGNTGASTGPHLHYEVHVNGKKVNPMTLDTGSRRMLKAQDMKRFHDLRERVDTMRTSQ